MQASSNISNHPGTRLERLRFNQSTPDRLSHYLFRYPAKFHPPIARKLVEQYSTEKDLILDPYCGSGTLLVEAILSNRCSIGIDIDPVAILASRVKTLSISYTALRRSSKTLLQALRRFERLESLYDQLMFEDMPVSEFELEIVGCRLDLPNIPNFAHWFRRYVAADLAKIRTQIDVIPIPHRHRLFFQLVFASIIRKSSNADPVPVSGLEVTSYMRTLDKKGRYINPFKIFRKALSRSLKDWEQYQSLRSRSRGTVELKQSDTMRIRASFRRKVDVIITSPPYHHAVDYYRRHTLEMYWLRLVNSHDERLRLRSQYIGRHGVAKSDAMAKHGKLRSPLAQKWEAILKGRQQERSNDFRHYVAAMSTCLSGMASCLNPNGRAVFVLGKNRSDGVELPSIEIFDEIASSEFRLHSEYWYPIRNRYMTYTRRNGANIDKEYVLVYQKR